MDNVLLLPGKALISTFRITFEYDTARGNRKTRKVDIKTTCEDQARFWFCQWIKTYNEERKFKAYSNEHILECTEIHRELVKI